ncbi:hypothetical protein MTO96_042406 [Rhipicephalus appendiculatus]
MTSITKMPKRVVRNALASAEAALASDGQCTPSTTTEALDGNQAYSGMRSPMTNAEVTELTESSTSDAEAGDSDVSSAFNATDLGTADVDAVQTEESSFPSTHPRSSTPVMDYAPQLDISVASECSDMASDEDDEIIQRADVNEADSIFAVSEASKVQKETDGSLLRITATCPLQHVWSWESQPVLNRKAVGNILLAGAILFTGSNPKKVLRLLSTIGVAVPKPRLFFVIQSALLFPSVYKLWTDQQERLLESSEPLSLAGDGRCDSPGFSAKYLTYTFIDASRDVILHTELVQVNAISQVRVQIAAMHYNENRGRKQAVTANGDGKWAVRFRKARHGYVHSPLEVLDRCSNYSSYKGGT